MTWTRRSGNGLPGSSYTGMAASEDQQRIVVVLDVGNVYISSDNGVSWQERVVGGGAKAWRGVACSSDCFTIVAGINNNPLWISRDGVRVATFSLCLSRGCYNSLILFIHSAPLPTLTRA